MGQTEFTKWTLYPSVVFDDSDDLNPGNNGLDGPLGRPRRVFGDGSESRLGRAEEKTFDGEIRSRTQLRIRGGTEVLPTIRTTEASVLPAVTAPFGAHALRQGVGP